MAKTDVAGFKKQLDALDEQRKKLIEKAGDSMKQEHADKVAEVRELETLMQSSGVSFRSAFGGSTRGPRVGGGGQRALREGGLPWKVNEAIKAAKGPISVADLKDKLKLGKKEAQLGVALTALKGRGEIVSPERGMYATA